MRIAKVEATWLSAPIPPERQHVSDFGRMTSFDTTLVRLETEEGIVGYGEAKAAVGSQANVGGAASAPIVASAFHPSLAPVGVLLAVLGYALGTYGAYATAEIMRLIY